MKSIRWYFPTLASRDRGTPQVRGISYTTALDGILLINFSINWQSHCLPSFWTASFQWPSSLCLCLAREHGQPVQCGYLSAQRKGKSVIVLSQLHAFSRVPGSYIILVNLLVIRLFSVRTPMCHLVLLLS